MSIKQVVMNGPFGQNLKHWLEYCDKCTDFITTYICNSTSEVCKIARTCYPNIRVVCLSSYSENPIRLAKSIAYEQHDAFILQGLYNYRQDFSLFMLVRARRKFIQIWNTTSYRRLLTEATPLMRFLFRWILRRSDCFMFSWEPNRQDFASLFPKLAYKTKFLSWGLADKYFDLNYAPSHPIVDSILAKIRSEDILIFWPRSLHPLNRHDLLIEALPLVRNQLSPDLWSKVKIILMSGPSPQTCVENLAEKIKRLSMSNLIWRHGEYIEKEYLLRLYDRANIYLNLADNDQITYGIIEAMSRRTHVILSDIAPYSYLLKLDLNLALVKNEPGAVAEAICEKIKHVDKVGDLALLDYNRSIVQARFGESMTFGPIFQYCLEHT